MVTLDTLRRLHEHAHHLAAYCPTCERWAVLNLGRLIAEVRGDYRFVGRKPRCRYCRAHGTWQFRSLVMCPKPDLIWRTVSDRTQTLTVSVRLRSGRTPIQSAYRLAALAPGLPASYCDGVTLERAR
jgi:hypothetical protein